MRDSWLSLRRGEKPRHAVAAASLRNLSSPSLLLEILPQNMSLKVKENSPKLSFMVQENQLDLGSLGLDRQNDKDTPPVWAWSFMFL